MYYLHLLTSAALVPPCCIAHQRRLKAGTWCPELAELAHKWHGLDSSHQLVDLSTVVGILGIEIDREMARVRARKRLLRGSRYRLIGFYLHRLPAFSRDGEGQKTTTFSRDKKKSAEEGKFA